MLPADGKCTRSAVIHAKFMVETRLFITSSSKKRFQPLVSSCNRAQVYSLRVMVVGAMIINHTG